MTRPKRARGVLLINVGTPDSPKTRDVRRYLRQFLNDPLVLDMNPIARKALLNFVILPTRPRRSARAYAKVWTAKGSPLLIHGQALRDALAKRLGSDFVVELGMRYGNPSIASALARLRQADLEELILFPLFPQYSTAASESALREASLQLGDPSTFAHVRRIDPFYDHPGFIEAIAAIAEPELAAFGADQVLFSYHGLPERQIRRCDDTGAHCLTRADCCDAIGAENSRCYRAHCFATSRALVKRLGLSPQKTSVSFQSRLGRTPWIRPFTDHVLEELPRAGVKRLAVLCPSFVADCLETLEEIGIRGREQWAKAGGEALLLIPSPNSHSVWVEAASQLILEHGASLSG